MQTEAIALPETQTGTRAKQTVAAMRFIDPLAIATSLLAASLLAACLPPMPDETGSDAGVATAPQETAFDLQELQLVAAYTTFTKINNQAYESSVGPFPINMYAYGDVPDYLKVHPETSGSNVTFSVGTLVVREVLDGKGDVAELTAIAKAPAGYDSTLGDWWFAQTDPAGNPMISSGVMQVGRLDACHGCHVPRATDDYLFGVPIGDGSQ